MTCPKQQYEIEHAYLDGIHVERKGRVRALYPISSIVMVGKILIESINFVHARLL
jgi:hypothetical protein